MTMYSIEFSVRTMCPIERKSNITIREDKSMVRTMTQCFIQCFYRQGSGPILHMLQRVFYQYNNIMWPPNERRISHFCDTLEIEEISVLWNFSYPYPYPETSLTLGMPRAYPITQYTAHSLERLPYSTKTSGNCHTAQRLPLQSPQHTQHTLASGRAYPWYPAYTVFRKAPGATQTTRLQDCKYCQPTESITKCPEEANTENTEKSLAEAA